MFFDGEQDQDPLVFAFFADAPIAEQAVGHVLHRLVVDGGDQHDGHLHAGHALQIGAVFFDGLFAGGVENTGEVVYVAGGLELRSVDGPGRQRE